MTKSKKREDMVFGSVEAAQQLKARFGSEVRTRIIKRRSSKDVPLYLEHLRQHQQASENSQMCFR